MNSNYIVSKNKKDGSKRSYKEKIALVMMIKNEEKRITVSFDSMKDVTDTFIILDTGSVDNTLNIVREYCKTNKINLHLKEEPFVNFEVSRNVLLDFADEVLPFNEKRYLVQLDCNDELQNKENLIKFAENFNGNQTGFHLKQKWFTGKSIDTYFNIRMVISHCGWRYKGVVHEYICRNGKSGGNDASDVIRLDDIILFQDRTKDDDKSFKRFTRDKNLLYTEYLKNPNDSRTLFYLAQTCGCLDLKHEAYQYYILRTKEDGFIEEIFHSYNRLGEISRALNHPWEESFMWFMKAFHHSQRAEPLISIAEYYLTHNYKGENKPDYLSSYMYAKMACDLIFPYNQILFIDRQCYTYKRYHTLGQCAYYVGRFKEGKQACLKAIMAEDREIDLQNLLWYLRKDKEMNSMNWQPQHTHLISIMNDKGEFRRQEDENPDAKLTEKEALKKGLEKLLGK
jgi:glycosyltransferase involved in cell wall biosynthesis